MPNDPGKAMPTPPFPPVPAISPSRFYPRLHLIIPPLAKVACNLHFGTAVTQKTLSCLIHGVDSSAFLREKETPPRCTAYLPTTSRISEYFSAGFRQARRRLAHRRKSLQRAQTMSAADSGQ